MYIAYREVAELFTTPEGWNVYRPELVTGPHPARGAMCDTSLGIQSRIVTGLACYRDRHSAPDGVQAHGVGKSV